MTWTKITPDNLPTDADNDKLYLFAEFYGPEKTLLTSEYDDWKGIKIYRERSLKHRYTHYMEVGRPKN